MPIIRDKAATTQPTTTFSVEEHTIDTRAGQGIDLTANPDLLLNPTRKVTGRFSTRDREGGQRVLSAMAAARPDLYGPHGTKRLVLVEDGDR